MLVLVLITIRSSYFGVFKALSAVMDVPGGRAAGLGGDRRKALIESAVAACTHAAARCQDSRDIVGSRSRDEYCSCEIGSATRTCLLGYAQKLAKGALVLQSGDTCLYGIAPSTLS